jgi:hypothetical protein
MVKEKSIFKSKTLWVSVLTFCYGIMPVLQDASATEKFTPAHLFEIFNFAVLMGATILTRYQGNSSVLFTPKGLPGIDPEQAKYMAEVFNQSMKNE